MTAYELAHEYMFSIKTKFPTRWVGETPAGYRLDVEYRGSGEGGEIWTNYDELVATVVKGLRKKFEDGSPGRPWLGIDGRIVSGVDWALLRADGVIEFDGQFVLSDELGPDPDASGVLVNARTSGAVDLFAGPDVTRPYSLQHCVDEVKAIGAMKYVGIALSIKFEAPGESEPWASKKYTRKKGQLKYIELSRGQFIAKGRLTSFASASALIDLHVFKIPVELPGPQP